MLPILQGIIFVEELVELFVHICIIIVKLKSIDSWKVLFIFKDLYSLKKGKTPY